MKAILHFYNYDTNKPEDREPYHKLKVNLEREIRDRARGHMMRSIPSKSCISTGHGGRGVEIELEVEHLFENQWDSNRGRVFDWYEAAYFNQFGRPLNNLKSGHWIELPQTLIDLRRNIVKCGYTGEVYPIVKEPKFNTSHKALSSPYLKEEDLHMLRLVPVIDSFRVTREPLTEEERNWLVPLYIEAQTKRRAEDTEKLLKKLKLDQEKKIELATEEYEGFVWLISNGIPTENVIYYPHTRTFCIGWRTSVSPEIKAVFESKLQDFPYKVEYK